MDKFNSKLLSALATVANVKKNYHIAVEDTNVLNLIVSTSEDDLNFVAVNITHIDNKHLTDTKLRIGRGRVSYKEHTLS